MMILISIFKNIGSLIQSRIDVSSKMRDAWVDMANSGRSEKKTLKKPIGDRESHSGITISSNWT